MNEPRVEPREPRAEPRTTLFAALFVFAVVLAFYAGRSCAPSFSPQPVEELWIDAGPGETVIAATLDGATVRHDEEIARIEREHAADLATFDARQREKYDVLRSGGERVPRQLQPSLS